MPYKGNLILQQTNFEVIKFKLFNTFFSAITYLQNLKEKK